MSLKPPERALPYGNFHHISVKISESFLQRKQMKQQNKTRQHGQNYNIRNYILFRFEFAQDHVKEARAFGAFVFPKAIVGKNRKNSANASSSPESTISK
jgi:hypothetical protein